MDEPHDPVPSHLSHLVHVVRRVLHGLALVVTIILIVVVVALARRDGVVPVEWLLFALILVVEGVVLFRRWLEQRRDQERTSDASPIGCACPLRQGRAVVLEVPDGWDGSGATLPTRRAVAMGECVDDLSRR